MKINLTKQAKNPYRSRATGSLTFVYDVSGTPEELAAYKATKKEFYRENEAKAPLFFTQTFAGKECDMKASAKTGNFYPEINELAVLAEAAALYGIGVANHICTPKVLKQEIEA